MKYSPTALFSLVAYLASMSIAHAYDREPMMTDAEKLKRGPNPIPNPPRTFKRANETVDTECFAWETRVQIGLQSVICRQKCPPGYGTSEDECVWEQSFTPHMRKSHIRSLNSGDHCFDEAEPRTYQVNQKGKKITMQLQLREVRTVNKVFSSIACTAKCPTGFGWATALKNRCVFKENYACIGKPALPAGSTDEDEPAPIQRQCAHKCAPGYKLNTKNLLECLWTGEKN